MAPDEESHPLVVDAPDFSAPGRESRFVGVVIAGRGGEDLRQMAVVSGVVPGERKDAKSPEVSWFGPV